MNKTIISYGIIAGLIVSGMVLLTFSSSFVNFENGEIFGYSSMVIAFATIFVAVKTQRDKYQSGKLLFGQAFKTGLSITLIASAIYVGSWMIMSETIAKDFMEEYYQMSISEIESSDLSALEKDEQLEDAAYFKELYKNPFFKIGITFLEIFPVGLLFSLLAAFILKTKNIPASA